MSETILTMPPKKSRSLHGQIRHLQDNKRLLYGKDSAFIHKARNIQHREQQAKDAGLTEHEMGKIHGDDFKKDKPLINKFTPFRQYPKGVTQNRLRGPGLFGQGMSWKEQSEYLQKKEIRLQKNHEAKLKSYENKTKAIKEIKRMYKSGEIDKLKKDQKNMLRTVREMNYYGFKK